MPHHPLLNKLKSLGISSYVLRWIADYLTSRLQCVVIEGDKSAVAQALSWVPQGSVLGPLLFLIYIDEISAIPLSTEILRVVVSSMQMMCAYIGQYLLVVILDVCSERY